MRTIGLRGWLVLAGLGVFGGSHCALAQTGVTRVAWACWYDGDTGVLCLLQHAPDESEAAPAANPVYPARSLPTFVRQIRESPSTLMDQPIGIPLYSVPIDMDNVRDLAESVMCGSKPQCAIAFGRTYAEAAGTLARR